MIAGVRAAENVKDRYSVSVISVKKSIQARGKSNMNKKLLCSVLLTGALGIYGVGVPAAGAGAKQAAATTQDSTQSAQAARDQDIELLRKDIRSKKKQLIAANLKLTDAEATKFWPTYDQYTADLVKINNEKYALIKEYADTWGTMTDAQADALIKRSLAVDEQVAQLRIRYVPIFNQVLPGTKTATFFQLDRRIQAMIDLQLSAQLPLVQAQN